MSTATPWSRDKLPMACRNGLPAHTMSTGLLRRSCRAEPVAQARRFPPRGGLPGPEDAGKQDRRQQTGGGTWRKAVGLHGFPSHTLFCLTMPCEKRGKTAVEGKKHWCNFPLSIRMEARRARSGLVGKGIQRVSNETSNTTPAGVLRAVSGKPRYGGFSCRRVAALPRRHLAAPGATRPAARFAAGPSSPWAFSAISRTTTVSAARCWTRTARSARWRKTASAACGCGPGRRPSGGNWTC